MVSHTREITCLTLVSRRGVSSGPRKYLLTTTLVAICDHDVGISTSCCSKTFSPLSLPMTALRRSQVTSSKGCTPSWVKRRSTFSPAAAESSTRPVPDVPRARRRPPVVAAESAESVAETSSAETGRSTVFPRQKSRRGASVAVTCAETAPRVGVSPDHAGVNPDYPTSWGSLVPWPPYVDTPRRRRQGVRGTDHAPYGVLSAAPQPRLSTPRWSSGRSIRTSTRRLPASSRNSPRP